MKNILLITTLFFATNYLFSQPTITFQTITSGFSSPVDVVEVNDGSNRLFVVEKSGTIRILTAGAPSTTPFLNVTSLLTSPAGSEQGLLSLAFHPNYALNGYFFIWYTNTSGAVTLARYSRGSSTEADPASGVILLTIAKPFSNHNGAKLNFGPDGYLYFGTGDGGAGGDPNNNAQNGASLLGKMLRIDVSNFNTPPYYSIPPTNPYAGSTTIRPEIIAMGLRNPWRWSFDKQTGDMWLPDVGQNLWEEVNVKPAASILAANYGWSCYEATHFFKANCGETVGTVYTDPIFEYPHNNTNGGFSITGGYVYRGTEFPILQGYYLFTDYVSRNGWLTKSNGSGGWTTTMQPAWSSVGLSSFGETSNGTLYATSLSGTLFKVVATDPLPVHLVSFTGTQSGSSHELKWNVQNEETGDIYILEKRTDPAQAYIEVSRNVVYANRNTNSYTTKVAATSNQTYYRLQIKSADGRSSFSSIVVLQNKRRQPLVAVITGNTLQLSFQPKTTSITLFDATGRVLLKKLISGSLTNQNISLANIPKGIITIKTQTEDTVESARIVY